MASLVSTYSSPDSNPRAAIATAQGLYGVAGCRVTTHGLHLGHVYGAFLPRMARPEVSTVYFVLTDFHGGKRWRDTKAVLRIVRQLMALGELHCPTVPVRESSLRPIIAPLITAMTEVFTKNRLDDVLPNHFSHSSDTNDLVLSDYLFPIYQTAYMLGLDARFAFYNDDNKRFVDLARLLAGRINRECGYAINSDLTLVAHEPSRLLGSDGERMTIANQNFLPLDASPKQIRNYARRLVGRLTPRDILFETSESTDVELSYYSFEGFDAVGERVCGAQRIDKLADILETYLGRYRTIYRKIDGSNVEAYLQDGEKEAQSRIGYVLGTPQ